MKKIILISLFLAALIGHTPAQPVPTEEENIPYLVTFGGDACPSWGDDNFTQTFFFLVPEEHTDPVYIRVFNPGTGSSIDEINGVWNTRVNFSIYGGNEAWSHPDAQETEPVGNYRSGNQMASKTFGSEPEYLETWYTFGPFNPMEGEYVEKFGGHIFKVIAQGVEGDDGNLYRYYLSTDPDENIPVEGGNAFAYSYTFRLWNDPQQVSHIYPFIDEETVSLKVSNFDWDYDGEIRVASTVRQGKLLTVSGDDDWVVDEFEIFPEEQGATLDIQFHKQESPLIRNNNAVINIRNQYGDLQPFFVVPIGGVPQYKYSIGVKRRE